MGYREQKLWGAPWKPNWYHSISHKYANEFFRFHNKQFVPAELGSVSNYLKQAKAVGLIWND